MSKNGAVFVHSGGDEPVLAAVLAWLPAGTVPVDNGEEWILDFAGGTCSVWKGDDIGRGIDDIPGPVRCVVVWTRDGWLPATLALATHLRAAGLRVTLDPDDPELLAEAAAAGVSAA